MLHGEAFVFDAGQEMAVLEILFDGFDGLFFLGAGDGGSDCGQAVVVAGGSGGEGEKWVGGSGKKGFGLGLG